MIFGSCLKAEEIVQHESDSGTNCSWIAWNGPQWSDEETG